MIFSYLLVLEFSLLVCTAGLIHEVSQLPLDDQGHLRSNWLLFQESNDCGYKIKEYWREGDYELRNLEEMSNEFADLFYTNVNSTNSICKAVCLERGTPFSYIKYPIPPKIYNGGERSLNDWMWKNCQAMEVGFISYLDAPAFVYWINDQNERIKIADLKRGEKNTFWTKTFLGHKFEIVHSVTLKIIGEYVVEYNAFFPLGDSGSGIHDEPNEEEEIRGVLSHEWSRANRVTRTFTELGFKKGRMPDDVWGSIQTYYYNNKNHYTREEYRGFVVNWHEVDPQFIGMPWGLKGYWQTRLRELVQNWIGNNITLENTDIYGMRRYQDGARLLTHVDREATHATSLIINVDQRDVREPWKVEIYDHAFRLHEIEMSPGDIVYYESAKCLHGRMKPLQGAYYVNLFTHYRPLGDPEWFLKPNPEGTVEPLIDLNGECYEADGGEKVCESPIVLPTLSPSGHVVGDDSNLFQYWKQVSPAQ